MGAVQERKLAVTVPLMRDILKDVFFVLYSEPLSLRCSGHKAQSLLRTHHLIWHCCVPTAVSWLQEAKLPLWLRPFEVLVTSSRTALIEMIPDTLSIHALKSRSPANMSLRNHFYAKFVRVSHV